MKRHELYAARLQERLDRLDEDAEYAQLRERAGQPYDWQRSAVALALVWSDPHMGAHSVHVDRLGAA